MLDRSFTMNGIDLREEYGLLVESVDRPIMAQLRARKTTIPFRSGSIDFGAKYRNEMRITDKCGCRALSRDDIRELAYILSQKGQIVFWDDPDCYYIGRIYDEQDLQMVSTLNKLTINFTCDPCTYGKEVILNFQDHKDHSYKGTEETPCQIRITNNNDYPVKNITIMIKENPK